MVINKLKKLVSLRASDRVKKCLISECLRDNELNSADCQMVLEWAFSCIVNHDSASVMSMGWETLKSLESREDVALESMITCDLVSLLLRREPTTNMAEVPALLSWCIKHNTSEELVRLLRDNAACMVLLCTGRGPLTLLSILGLFDKHPRLQPTDFTQLLALTEAVAICLSVMPMPPTKPGELQEFFIRVNKITDFLRNIWTKCSEQGYRQMAVTALKVMYSAISNTGKGDDRANFFTAVQGPGCCISPALAWLLELVGLDMMPDAVEAMVQGSACQEKLVHMLTVLCMWLLQAPRCTSVHRWVLALVSALETQCRYEVLLTVARSNTMEQLFQALVLPALRPGVTPVLWHFLAASRRQDIFFRVAKLVPTVVSALHRESSDAGRLCLHTILDMCHSYMELFPGHDQLYRPILALMQEMPDYVSQQFLKPSDTVWSVQQSPVTLQVQGSVQSDSHVGRIGLINLGNTCYMNSVLQALFRTKRFCHAILSASCTHSQAVLEKLQELFTLLTCSQRPSLSPDQVLAVCRPLDFHTGHQQDSSEFLTHLLDALHEEELIQANTTTTVIQQQPASGKGKSAAKTSAEDDSMGEEDRCTGSITRWTTEEDLSDSSTLHKSTRTTGEGDGEGNESQLSSSPSDSTDSGIQSCRDTDSPCPSQGVGPPLHTIVEQCFGGKMLTTYQCHDCKTDSLHTDMFRDIQLSFPDDHDDEEHSLQGLIEYFLSPEELCGDNRYWCEKCGGLRDATRSLAVLEAPSHLLLTLKHFRYDAAKRQRTKLLHRVTYSGCVHVPVVTHRGRAQHHESYRLYAAVVHSGKSMDSGHYYTYALDSCDDRWYEFNDDVVLARSMDSLSRWHLADTPYILFYARESARSPDVPVFSGLSARLEELVARDTLSYIQETKAEEEKRRKQEVRNKMVTARQHQWNGDWDEDPPSGCGDGVHLGTQPNRFIF